MSSPIKPPGGPKATDGLPAEADSSSVDGSFKKALDGVSSAAVSGSEGASGAVGSIAADLKAGRITSDAAVDRLIESTVGSEVAKSLTASAKNELGAMLRDALSTDPALQTLLQQMRGSE